MALKTERLYRFKPMKGMTFWARLLMGIEVFGLILWAAAMTLSMAGFAQPSAMAMKGGMMAEGELVVGLLLILGIAFVVPSIIIGGIVSLCWVYGATRNAKAIRPGGVQTTPGWAVGWFFVPFASLYKPYETLRDVWVSSKGPVNGKYPKGSPLIIFWWLTFIAGNITLRFSGDDSNSGSLVYAASFSNIMMVVGILTIAVSTSAFFIMVGQISRNQVTMNARVADVF